jgi:hypothetical protein
MKNRTVPSTDIDRIPEFLSPFVRAMFNNTLAATILRALIATITGSILNQISSATGNFIRYRYLHAQQNHKKHTWYLSLFSSGLRSRGLGLVEFVFDCCPSLIRICHVMCQIHPADVVLLVLICILKAIYNDCSTGTARCCVEMSLGIYCLWIGEPCEPSEIPDASQS